MLQKSVSSRPEAHQVLNHAWFREQPWVFAGRRARAMTTAMTQHINLIASRNRVRQVLLTALAAKLRFEHVEECLAIFCRIDRDNTGTIPRESFKNACRQLRIQSEEAEASFEMADITASNTLEFNEFVALTLDWQKME